MRDLVDYSDEYEKFHLTQQGWVDINHRHNSKVYAIEYHRTRRHALRKGIKEEFHRVKVTIQSDATESLFQKFGRTHAEKKNLEKENTLRKEQDERDAFVELASLSFSELALCLDDKKTKEAFLSKAELLIALYKQAPLTARERARRKTEASPEKLKKFWSHLYFDPTHESSMELAGMGEIYIDPKLIELATSGQLDKVQAAAVSR